MEALELFGNSIKWVFDKIIFIKKQTDVSVECEDSIQVEHKYEIFDINHLIEKYTRKYP